MKNKAQDNEAEMASPSAILAARLSALFFV